ncbi:FAD-binding protein, partial [Enterococcus entomosocium]
MIAQFPEIALLKDEPLLNYTYTKTGGPADILAFPKTAEEAKQLLDYCREQAIPWIVLGNASNLIVRDGGIRGVVIMLSEMNQIVVDGTSLIVDAGAKLIDTTYVALHESLTGFEFACGIPGSVGGAVFMNAGAYDGEIQDVFASCDVLLADGQIVTYTKEEMEFAYRHSKLQEQKMIILSSRFDLTKGDQEQIKKRMDELTELRQLKQPLEYPS